MRLQGRPEPIQVRSEIPGVVLKVVSFLRRDRLLLLAFPILYPQCRYSHKTMRCIEGSNVLSNLVEQLVEADLWVVRPFSA